MNDQYSDRDGIPANPGAHCEPTLGYELEQGQSERVVLLLGVSPEIREAFGAFAIWEVVVGTGIQTLITVPLIVALTPPVGILAGNLISHLLHDIFLDRAEERVASLLGVVFDSALKDISPQKAEELGEMVLNIAIKQNLNPQQGETVQENTDLEMEHDRLHRVADSRVIMTVANHFIPFLNISSDALHAGLTAHEGVQRLSIDVFRNSFFRNLDNFGRLLFTWSNKKNIQNNADYTEVRERALNMFAGYLAVLLIRYPGITSIKLESIPYEFEDQSDNPNERKLEKYAFLDIMRKVISCVNNHEQELRQNLARDGRRRIFLAIRQSPRERSASS